LQYGRTVKRTGGDLMLITKERRKVALKGIGISGGVATGRLCYFTRYTFDNMPETSDDPNREIDKWINAVTTACEQLGRLSDVTKRRAGAGMAALFEAHLVMLSDVEFGDRVSEFIHSYGMSAETAIHKTAQEFYNMFAAMDDEYMSARCMDVIDIAIRVLSIMVGCEERFDDISPESIMLSSFLTPSEAANMMFSGVSGFVLSNADKNSHTAILARTLGVPLISGIDADRSFAYVGAEATINGSTGEVKFI